MFRRCELFALIALAGCNPVFGVDQTVLVDAPPEIDVLPPLADRDRDQIPDVDDPCIAGIADRLTDAEFDGKPNESDPCPFDIDSGIDSDMDMIYDECDPLLTNQGDRRRCVMAFQNPTINRELWTPRGDAMAWDLLHGELHALADGTVVAGESFEAPIATSYDFRLVPSSPVPPATSSVITLWLRTGDQPSPADVGCELRGGSSTTLTVIGAKTPTILVSGQTLASVAKLQATVFADAPAGTKNVRCAIRFAGAFSMVGVAAEVTLPAGRLGLSVVANTTSFVGLVTIERDDQPPL